MADRISHLARLTDGLLRKGFCGAAGEVDGRVIEEIRHSLDHPALFRETHSITRRRRKLRSL